MLNAIIIDDEKAAISTLTVLLEKYVPEVKLLTATTSCPEGIRSINTLRPDIVFLDISMPDMDGFSLLQQLQYRDFHLIFTTAHEQYALQAIRHHATDYLVKPIDVDELKQAVQTVIGLLQPDKSEQPGPEMRRLDMNGRIGLPIREGLVYLQVSEIVWIESNNSYCTFHTAHGGKYVVAKSIGEYESILPQKEFFRSHKSYLINIRAVRKYVRNDGYFVEMSDGTLVEISRRRKDEFLQLMNEVN